MDGPMLSPPSAPVFSTALILCGGLGTRLRPLTQSTPKPLVDIANIPLIEHILEQLISQGVSCVVLAVGSCALSYAPHLPYWRRVFTRDIFTVSDGDELGNPLGTGGAILHTTQSLPHLFAEPFYVLNGDILVTQPLECLARALKTHKALAALAAMPVQDCSAYGALELSEDSHILSFAEKATTGPGTANAGLYALAPEALAPAQGLFRKPSSIERDVFPLLAKEGKAVAVVLPADVPWYDLGTVRSFSLVTRWMLKEGLNQPCVSARVAKHIHETAEMKINGVIKPPSLVSPAAIISSDCVIGPNAVIGDGCILGEGCLVKDSVILKGATVGKHCVVIDSVISPYVAVKDDTTVEDTVL